MTRLTKLSILFLTVAWLGVGCDDSGSKPSTAGAGAQATGGGGGAATAATVKPSPARDAAVAWARAIAAGDVAAARAASTGSEAELEAAGAYFAVGAAEAKFNALVKEKFGGEQTGGLLHALAARLAQAEATEAPGGTVMLTHEEINSPVVVHKQPDGTWKVDVAEVAAAEPIFKNMAKGYADAEAALQEGKYDTAEAAWAGAAARIATRSGAPGGSGGGPGGGPGRGGPGGGGPGRGGPGAGGPPGGGGQTPPAPGAEDGAAK
jgi:hypothetical protein